MGCSPSPAVRCCVDRRVAHLGGPHAIASSRRSRSGSRVTCQAARWSRPARRYADQSISCSQICSISSATLVPDERLERGDQAVQDHAQRPRRCKRIDVAARKDLLRRHARRRPIICMLFMRRLRSGAFALRARADVWTVVLGARNRFSGFRSRCAIWLACALVRPAHAWRTQLTAVAMSSQPLAIRPGRCPRHDDVRRALVIADVSFTRQMRSLWTCAAARASRGAQRPRPCRPSCTWARRACPAQIASRRPRRPCRRGRARDRSGICRRQQCRLEHPPS